MPVTTTPTLRLSHARTLRRVEDALIISAALLRAQTTGLTRESRVIALTRVWCGELEPAGASVKATSFGDAAAREELLVALARAARRVENYQFIVGRGDEDHGLLVDAWNALRVACAALEGWR